MRGKQFLHRQQFYFQKIKKPRAMIMLTKMLILPVFLKYTLVILLNYQQNQMSFFAHIKFTASILFLNGK